MSLRIPPRWNRRDNDATRRRDTELRELIDEWSLPEDPDERRRIKNRLIMLAAALPIVQLMRWLFR
jgi:hypothetical protein